MKSCRCNTNDGELLGVDLHLLPDDAIGTAEPRYPVVVPDDGYRLGPRLIICRLQHAPAQRADFEQVEENSLTWGFGGGLSMFFSTHYGIQFDFRYFRTFDDVELFGVEVIDDQPGKLDFTRTSLCFVFRF